MNTLKEDIKEMKDRLLLLESDMHQIKLTVEEVHDALEKLNNERKEVSHDHNDT